MNFKNILNDDIFSDFLHSVDVDVDLNHIESEIKRFREIDQKGAHHSNRGGYHSQMMHKQYMDDKSDILSELVDGIEWYVAEYVKTNIKDNYITKLCNWWFMINNKGNWNSPHSHGHTDIAAIFYVKVPENSGKLVLKRTDGAHYIDMYNSTSTLEIAPQEGRLYLFPAHILHWVEPSQSDEERICITSNIKVHTSD